MEKTIGRLLVERVVRKAIKDIKESPERSVRNLVDMALQFSDGRFQHRFFDIAHKMLENEDSGYYRLIRDTAALADSEHIYAFGMNLGYNGCTVGAARIRENEKSLGCNIPWAVLLSADPMNMASYSNAIAEGEELGIYVWGLFPTQDPAALLPLVSSHPDSAFIFFAGSEDIEPAFVDEAAAAENLMIAVRYDENEINEYLALRERGMICSVWYSYGSEDEELISSGDLFLCTQDISPLFTILIPEPGCPENVRKSVYEAVLAARNEQSYHTIPWSLPDDNRQVDRIISEDDCFAYFDAEGNLAGRDKDCNLFSMGLADIFRKAFPKKADISS